MKKLVFVSDLFIDTYRGGAELTTDAIMRAGNPDTAEITKINSHALTIEALDKHKDAHWVVCNFSSVGDEAKIHMCKNMNYSIIEYDYKICHYRSLQKHKMATGVECNCLQDMSGKINTAFYGYAKKIWFMSVAQKDIFLSKVSVLKEDNCQVLSSIFLPGDLRFMNSIKNNEKDDTYLILGSQSWIKGTQDSINFAHAEGLEYEVIQGLPYHELLIKMSTAKGLIFRPLGDDTCPRIVIEAKLLGCDLILNDHVQHKDEEWFKTQESCNKYLQERAGEFWSHYG